MLFTASSLTPVIPQIAEDLKTTGTIVNFSVGLSLFTSAFGGLFWSRYAGYFGRRRIYDLTLPLYFLASLGVAGSRNVPELIISRALQAFGCSAFHSVGEAVITDVFKLEHRGRAMGLYGCLALLGPAAAPLVGGLVSERLSWRIMQAGLGGVGIVMLALIIAYLPETMHPGTRGIDKIDVKNKKARVVFLNPLIPLGLLKSPVLFLSTVGPALTLATDYIMLIPLAYTIGQRYGITNKALLGTLFIPSGLGNMFGMPVSGWLSDRSINKWRSLREGRWIPEDRLRATWLGSLYLVPISTMGLGLVCQFVDGTPGICLNMLFLLTHAIGMCLVVSPCSTYNVDVMQDRSAEAVAAKNAVRSIIVSAAIFGILPTIEAIGVLWTNVLASCLAWIAFGLIYVCIRYGPYLRAWSSVKHTDESSRT
ncbi:MFS general substrate transporter [Sistotremastrum niveocremeum HHB9708]|uniref:MFS general substrate transporter n=1 Tax=Sistotremastrum niveocremeum HHB9708 TaxID=1314777 RepID=A0A164QPF9_9AGAM|nr:MFS general substrate transporter [Sistotremastrum niveocremeum HHB9708]